VAEAPSPTSAPRPSDRLQNWPQRWVSALANLTSVTAARRQQVLLEIHEGSQATPIYYVLLGLSEAIAGFALLINSDATLIGANVVAPLMTPIMGVSLGLMRGDFRLLRAALVAEFGGALLGVAICFLLGLLPFGLEPSVALLSQTRPTLIDLAVAGCAGLAGVLAMIDERISPALPGVAIATALNPPIAAIGLCLAFGAYEGAWGALVLFFANVLAILAVAAVMFLAAGFVTREEIGSVRSLARRFAPAAISLALVTGLLTTYLVRMVTDLRTQRTINAVLDEELADEPGTALVNVESDEEEGALDVLANVRTPRVLAPERVKRMQDVLAERLHRPVRMFVRCAVTKDVAATGSTEVRPYLGLGGKAVEASMSADTRLLLQAEQLAREIVATRPDLVLTDVELVQLASGPVLIFSIQNPREPTSDGISAFEDALRTRLNAPDVRVVVRTVESSDLTAKGRILFGAAHFADLSPQERALQKSIEDATEKALEAIPNMIVTAVDAVRGDAAWRVRTEVDGPRMLTPQEVAKVEKAVTPVAGGPVELSARVRTDLVVTPRGYASVGAPHKEAAPLVSGEDVPAAAPVTETAPSPSVAPKAAAAGTAKPPGSAGAQTKNAEPKSKRTP
jgi:uncharacterized hydrophobic protein (TIGR00271 family)